MKNTFCKLIKCLLNVNLRICRKFEINLQNAKESEFKFCLDPKRNIKKSISIRAEFYGNPKPVKFRKIR